MIHWYKFIYYGNEYIDSGWDLDIITFTILFTWIFK
jgi:hypothetical protein